MSTESKKKGLWDLTIKEAKELGLSIGDLFAIDVQGKTATLNLSWDKVIKTANYLNGKEVLNDGSTLRQAFTIMQGFLV